MHYFEIVQILYNMINGAYELRHFVWSFWWQDANGDDISAIILKTLCNSYEGLSPVIGESLQSSSPLDITFWPTHPNVDRLLHWKRIATVSFVLLFVAHPRVDSELRWCHFKHCVSHGLLATSTFLGIILLVYVFFRNLVAGLRGPCVGSKRRRRKRKLLRPRTGRQADLEEPL